MNILKPVYNKQKESETYVDFPGDIVSYLPEDMQSTYSFKKIGSGNPQTTAATITI